MLKIAGVVVLVLAGAAVLWAGWQYYGYRQRMAEAEARWDAIAARATAGGVYDPAMVAGLPEIAQRYFNHAIAPGTPLATTVALEMTGTFLLGATEAAAQRFAMTARQILAAPAEFVWMPRLTSGPMVITGSDGLYDGHAWTRFWMFGTVPLVQAAATEGLDRAAAARPAIEAIWAPASLLPANGALWEQTGPHTARVTLQTNGLEIGIDMTLNADGGVTEIVTQRWSNANPEQAYRLQPFGGTVLAEATFGGFTIPGVVHVGNLYGEDGYFPFFQARIVGARYLE